MALLVWLPLTGDLRNLGLDRDYDTPSTNYAVWASEGKIGSKSLYPTTTTSGVLSYSKTLSNSHSYSICAWVKTTEEATGSRYIVWTGSDSNYVGFGFRCLYNTDSIQVVVFGSSITLNTGLNQWHHIAMIVDYENLLFSVYLDGIFVLSETYTQRTVADNGVNIGWLRPSYYPYKGYINDVRIYDHCLSPKEVKEISKGLVLHYKLDDTDFGNPNLLKGTEYLDTDVTVYSGVTKTANAYKHFTSATYDNSSGASMHELMEWNKKITVNANDVYTLSFYAKSAVSTMVACFFWNNNANIVLVQSGISSEGTTTSARDGNIDVPLTPEWKRYWITWTFDSTATSATKTILFRCQPRRGDISVCGVKLEKGNKATPTDPIIYDCSGYLNNGVVIRNLLTDSQDIPRYNSSIKFTETTTKIKAGSINTLGFGDSYTFAWWGKISTFSGKMFWGFSDGIRLNGIYNGNLWNTGDSSDNPLYEPGTTTQVTAPSVNVWHHFVMVGNGTTCLVYLDGVLWGLAKTYKSISGTTIFLNGWDANTNYANNNTCISDFRIYSTALSEEDVKELYNTSAIVDNLGNNYCYLFEELIGNTPQALDITTLITKLGILSTGQLKEEDIQQVLISEDKYITVNQLIEM